MGLVAIKVVSNVGAGSNENVKVQQGVNVEQLSEDMGLSLETTGFRVNGVEERRDYELNEGDTISFTPRKIAGAAGVKKVVKKSVKKVAKKKVVKKK
jgi:hypothetical protein